MLKSIHHSLLKFIAVTFLLLVFSFFVKGQQRCSTVEYNQWLHQTHQVKETKDQFEQWIREKKVIKQTLLQSAKSTATLLTIPVVVHVIHQGESIGNGSNISDAQIISQIDVLNEDFRRMNVDASETLAEFVGVADDMEIEFIMAKQDPEGLPTNGIQRVQADQGDYDINETLKLSNLSYWPAEDYLNIWVTTLDNNLLGYAQFPVSSLEGLEGSSNNPLTDGVVIRYQSFGSSDKGSFPVLQSPYDLGRTTTHEIGHFLGLRHIWGDGGCGVDDFCDDTPIASSEHEGCNLSRQSCGQLSMVQNYMDYTNDQCMNIFTTDQKSRMRIVMENSPRRVTLTTSLGGIDPTPFTDDLGVKEIFDPVSGLCLSTVNPSIEIRNYGSNPVTAAQISLISDSVPIETLNLSLNLDPLEMAVVNFAPLTGLNLGSHDISFEIISTNGGQDNNTINDAMGITYSIKEILNEGVVENFEVMPADWEIVNADAGLGWQMVEAPGYSSQDNQAMAMINFNYDDGFGEIDELRSPVFDLSDAYSAELSLRYAYTYRASQFDRLTIAVSTDCGNTFSDILFEEVGTSLATVDQANFYYNTGDRFDWRTMSFDLSEFVGANYFQIAFIAQNGNGNNLYLDDVEIDFKTKKTFDLAIENINAPGFMSCGSATLAEIRVRNVGTATINDFMVTMDVDGEILNKSFSVTLTPGESYNALFDSQNLEAGNHHLQFTVSQPNGQPDEDNENNHLETAYLISTSATLVPFREQFKTLSFDETNWSVANPDNDMTWEITAAPGNGTNNLAARYNAYNNENIGSEDALVSPILDLNNIDYASLTFKYSYASVDNHEEILKVFISTDCGNTFPYLIHLNRGVAMGLTSTNNSWVPVTDTDWREVFLNLSDYTGNSNVRIAFVMENGYGNNFYLDDIEFFLTSSQNLPRPEEGTTIIYPNPVTGNSLKATFNLVENQDIKFSLLDVAGKLVFSKLLPNTLNQTYAFNLPQLNNGLYFVVINAQNFKEVSKLIIEK